MEEIGSRLKQIIDEMGLNASEFSERVGIQRSSLSHLFSGRNKPSIDFLIKIKSAFPETDLEWLITGQPSQKSKAELSEDNDTIEIGDKRLVTNVNTPSLTNDNQGITTDTNEVARASTPTKEIESIVLFYTDGSFKEYKNTPYP
jgi:transcriptional regulator with XRE-family HTH domain